MPSAFPLILEWLLANRHLVVYAVLVVLLGYGVRYVTVAYLKSLAKQTENSVDNLAVAVVQSIGWWSLLAVALFLVTRGLDVWWLKILDAVVILMVTRQLTLILKAVFYFARRELASRGGKPIIHGFKTIIDMVIWVLGFLAVLANFGFDVTTFVAGLGIGGVAVALALKSLLSDVFASLSIYFDKPFTVGDYIQRGAYEGEVEEIGLKTTRLRSPQGEQLIVANSELTSSTVQNFGRLKTRRITDLLHLPFETERERIDQLQQVVREAFHGIDGAEFSRLHIKSIEDGSLTLELVYFADSKHVEAYKDIEHEVNLALRDALLTCQLTLA